MLVLNCSENCKKFWSRLTCWVNGRETSRRYSFISFCWVNGRETFKNINMKFSPLSGLVVWGSCEVGSFEVIVN